MPQTLSKVYVHLVFSTKNRTETLPKAHLDEVFAYVASVVNANHCRAIRVGGTSNHIHVLFLQGNTISLSDLVRTIKSCTSRWINSKTNLFPHFCWQSGFGAFSVSQSQADRVIKYIEGQAEHHKKVSFQEEFLRICKLYDVAVDERYVWD